MICVVLFATLLGACLAAAEAAPAAIEQPIPASFPRMMTRINGDQDPKWLDALFILRGGKDLTTEEQQDLIKNAVPGQDYPLNVVVPEPGPDCASYKQAGYYADVSDPSKCQAFHYCGLNGENFGFLCPNMTLFNQITLVCDWFFNVDCSKSYQFIDFSNSRLHIGSETVLLDDQLVYPSASGVKSYRPNDYKPRTPAPYTTKPVRTYPTTTRSYTTRTQPTTTRSYTTRTQPTNTRYTRATPAPYTTTTTATTTTAAPEY